VLLTDNKRHKVEYAVVDFDLSGQSGQSVPVALDLEASERPVDYCDVSPDGTLAQPELVDHESPVVTMLVPEQLVQGKANVSVAHHRPA